MTRNELEKKLSSFEVPPISLARRDAQLERARLAFVHGAHEAIGDKTRRRSWFVFGSLSGAIASLALVYVFWLPTNSPSGAINHHYDQELLQEMQSVFGGSLKAVVANGGSPSVLLGENEESHGQSFPLVLELTSGKKKSRVMSFSGQTLSLTIDGKLLEFEVFLSGNGKILLITKDGASELKGETQIQGIGVKGYSL